MRVMLVPSAFHPHIGGVEQVTERLARGLIDRGVSVVVVTNQEPRDLPSHEVVDGLQIVRVPFRVPHPSVRGMGGWLALSRRSRRQLFEAAADVDLINVHCVSSQASYVRAVAEKRRTPLIVSTHGEVSGDATGAYQRDRRAIRAWRMLVKQADLVTAPSRYTLDEAADFLRAPMPPSEVISNGVDLDLFSERQQGQHGEGPPYVVAVGRLVQNKGFDLLVANCARVTGDARLVVVGEGPERPELERLRDASAAADRIEFLGARQRSEVAALMAGARALALTSHHEALGLVVLEAMAAGTPVVASRVGGVPEVVEEGVTGLLFDAGDADGLVNALDAVLTDPAAASARAARAREFASHFGWDVIVEAYLDAYTRVGATP